MLANEERYLSAALKAAELIATKLVQPDNSILHSYKNSKATIDGFLEDYAHFADAAIELYQVTMDDKWLLLAERISKYALEHFYDDNEKMFWFTSDKASDLVARKKEVFDNVIPSSNAVMGHFLFRLSLITENAGYFEITQKMITKPGAQIKQYAASLYCWAQLMHELSGKFYEVVITGPEAGLYLRKIYAAGYPGKIVIAAENNSELPLLKGRFKDKKTMIYVCRNRVCNRPVENVEEALEQLV